MDFSLILGIQDVDGKTNILRREAVRAIIVKKDKILKFLKRYLGVMNCQFQV